MHWVYPNPPAMTPRKVVFVILFVTNAFWKDQVLQVVTKPLEGIHGIHGSL